MKLEIKVPSVGESVTEGDIASWEKQSGDFVQQGEVLAVLETDKASLDIPAEKSGVLSIVRQKGVKVLVGEVIGFIDTSKVKPLENKSLNHNSKIQPASTPSSTLKDLKKESDIVQTGKNDFSPSVRRLVKTNQLNPTEITGTGRGGRLTKEDILTALSQTPKDTTSTPLADLQTHDSDPIVQKGQRREPMTRLRKITAKRLVHSQHSTATLSTFNEVDLSRIIEIRKKYQDEFVKKHGCKLGFMSFFVCAVRTALKQYPRLNAFIEGTDVVYNDHQHIGIAVGTEKGLVVPVIFNVENLTLAEIEKKILEYKNKALTRKLTPDDLLGGTFTISNGGVFGSLLSTPILNPPQSGILGMHKIEKRPIAHNGQVVIRPMMYVTLSYDHRMVDGRESVSFLVKIKETLEEPSRLLIDM